MSNTKQTKMSYLEGKKASAELINRKNIAELLINAAKTSNRGFVFLSKNEDTNRLSYSELLEMSLKALGALQQMGLKKGDKIILTPFDGKQFLISFWACILGGFIPAPIALPPMADSNSEQLKRFFKIYMQLDGPAIITDFAPKFEELLSKSVLRHNDLKIIDSTKLCSSNFKGTYVPAEKDDTALIQFSSGSTGLPKGVVLTNRNVISNVAALVDGIGVKKEDNILNWMPYYHNMALIGFMLGSTYAGAGFYSMATTDFISSPVNFLNEIERNNINITCIANFACKLLIDAIENESCPNYNLSTVKCIINGSEPISVPIMNKFSDLMIKFGMPDTAMDPGYGLSEASLAVCYSQVDLKPAIYSISRSELAKNNSVVLTKAGIKDSMQVVSEGFPLMGIDIRIVDEKGAILPEGKVGELQIRGDSITKGYYNDPQRTKESFSGEWFKTGDKAFIQNSEVSVIGREKDIIFINGKNFYAHDIENVIRSKIGRKLGEIAVCEKFDDDSASEQIVVFYTNHIENSDYNSAKAELGSLLSSSFGATLCQLYYIKKIPKTLNGKIMRNILKAYTEKIEEPRPVEKDKYNKAKEQPVSNDRNESVYSRVRKVWSEVLKIAPEKIELDDNFYKFGGTSIKALKILNGLETEFDRSFKYELLISCRTIREIGNYITSIEETGEKSSNNKTDARRMLQPEDIAVISVACRMPDADTPEQFWENIKNGHISIRNIPTDRFDIDEYYDKEGKAGKTSCRAGAFIGNVYDFDADYFGIDPDEAQVMDPQERIALELFESLICRSGYPKTYFEKNKTGLFLSTGDIQYKEFHLSSLYMEYIKRFKSFSTLPEQDRKNIISEWREKLGTTGDHQNKLVDNIPNMVAARLSHEYNLCGESFVVDSACSSALVALHLACQALNRGDCDIAVSGGINLILTPTPYIYFNKAGAISKSGQSRVFDENADGFVPGEGAGMVMLKKLSKAKADGDKILAVIKASAVNNDGHSLSVMAPNPDGQEKVIEELYSDYGINPFEIQYVEAHGTGTSIGDPSEVRAISNAFCKWGRKVNTIALGSIKSNIGHLLNAAGIASFIKVVLSLYYKTIPPVCNVKNPNHMLNLDKSPFYLPQTSKVWNVENGEKRRAAINSFGFGGTNCHMVLEEYCEDSSIGNSSNTNIFVPISLSGKTAQIVLNKAKSLSFDISNKNYNINDILLSSNALQDEDKFNICLAKSNNEDLIKSLKTIGPNDLHKRKDTKTVFMFTGQGSQYPGVAKSLYDSFPYFKNTVDECNDAFYPYIGRYITDLIFGDNGDILSRTDITQPVVFTIDYAIGKLLINYGIIPDYVIGHSLGEIAAAAISNCISLPNVAKLVSTRGKLMSEIKTEGAMAAVFADDNIILNMLKNYEGRLWPAAFNITHMTISGKADAIEEFIKDARNNGIICKKLKVSNAFHTPLMKGMLCEFKKCLDTIDFMAPKFPLISNVDADILKNTSNTDYWLRHVMSPVKFKQSIEKVTELGANTFIETGPDAVLANMVKRFKPDTEKTVIQTLSRKIDSNISIWRSLGEMFKVGLPVDWLKLKKEFGRNNIILSSYPFNRTYYGPNFGNNSKIKHLGLYHKWNFNEYQFTVKEKSKKRSTILVIHDKFQANLIPDLREKFGKVYEAVSADKYDFDGNNKFSLNLGRYEDFVQLFKEIKAPLAAVLQMTNYNKPIEDLNAVIHDDSYWNINIFSGLYCIKAIKSTGLHTKFILFTDCMFAVKTKEKNLNPQQYVASVLGQAADFECDNIDVLTADMDSGDYKDGRIPADLIEHIVNCEMPKDGIIAVRGKKVYERSLSKCSEQPKNCCEKKKEIILVTGGTGLITGDICKELSNGSDTGFAIVGRTPLEKVLQSNSEKYETIRELKSTGSRVEYFCADVTDCAQMEKVVNDVNNSMGKITGVIHAAGLIDTQSFKLLDKSIDTIKMVLAPKVFGTIATDMATKDQPLDYFAMLSSVSASKKDWSGGIGEYAAANAFMDGYATYRNLKNRNGKSIAVNYSLWSDKGMGNRLGSAAKVAALSSGLAPIESSLASKAFRPALFLDENVVHIFRENKDSASIEPSNVVSVKKDIYLHDYEGSIDDIPDTVFKAIREQLNLSELDINENFSEIGLDSIGAVSIAGKLSDILGIEIFPTLLFEYQTPALLAQYIKNLFKGRDKDNSIRNVNIPISTKEPTDNNNDIAIIGIGLRIPGAKTPEEFWNILINEKCMVSGIPENRWDKDLAICNSTLGQKLDEYKGGFLDNIFEFDPFYFGISPNEAKLMDPQQRIFLMVVAEALQRAGYARERGERNVGVFVGSEQNSYMERFLGKNSFNKAINALNQSKSFKALPQSMQTDILNDLLDGMRISNFAPDSVPGNALNQIACRVSHCFNFTGPAVLMNSACSSSLVAVHTACEMLRKGEIDMAIAGGVNINTSLSNYLCMNEVTALSKSGTCYPFDKRADGMVLSEGAGALLLKPLSKAQSDHDHIYAVIKGSAIGNDGHSQGLLAPRPQGQAKTIEAAYTFSGISPEKISYVECHGTGTPLGDPIEISGLTTAFSKFTDQTGFCGIGSVKSSIGHMLSASGVVSLIKVILAMQHHIIPATINFEEPNEHINFAATPFYVCNKAKKWEPNGEPLLAAVNSFGFGGTNAHVILEEAPYNTENAADYPQPLLLTGRSIDSIKKYAKILYNFLKKENYSLDSACRSINGMQRQMSFKTSTVVENKTDLENALEKISNGQDIETNRISRINPNKIISLSLCLDSAGISEILTTDFCNSYNEFKLAYNSCIYAYKKLNTDKNFEIIKVFATQYAFGILLRHLGALYNNIIACGTGLISAGCLSEMITIDEAISIVLNTDNNAEKKTLHQNCIITDGDVRISNVEELINAYNKDKITSKSWLEQFSNNPIIKLGSSEGHDQVISVENKNANSSVKIIAKLFADIYLCGAIFDFDKLSSQKAEKIVLPVCPFELNDYVADNCNSSQINIPDNSDTINNKTSNKPINKAMMLTQLSEDLTKI